MPCLSLARHLQIGDRMYIFSRKFLYEFRNDPREALDNLKLQKSRFWYYIISFIVFWRVVFSEYGLNHCLTRGSAMAYALLLTLIPLVASAAFMFASLTDVKAEQVEKLFAFFLPFAPQTVLNYLSTFFINAQKLKGIGLGVLIVVAVGLFGSVEESVNTIWKVSRSRSFFTRLRTFTMVMVYSPILILTSFQFRRSLRLDLVSGYLNFVPFLLMVLAFTSLIWFVPNTKVRFRSAFLGGLISGVLFELERRLFGTYVEMSIQAQTIYGTFWILPMFLLSLFLVSLFVLFGAQVAYVNQNFLPLLRAQKRWDRRVGDYKTYIAFRMMLDCVEAFIKRKTPPPLDFFTARYELTDPQALGILKWLVNQGFLHNVSSSRDSYVPSRDFSDTPVKEVLDAIEDQNRRIPTSPDDFDKYFVASLLQKTKECSGSSTGDMTFKMMIAELENGRMHAERLGAIA
jgi:membrane protein